MCCYNNIEIIILIDYKINYITKSRFFCLVFLCSLCQRKEQWKREEKERIANLPDPSVPEGHVLMARKEKENTLRLLQDRKLLTTNHNLVF